MATGNSHKVVIEGSTPSSATKANIGDQMTLEDKIVLIRTIIDDPIGGWVTPSLIKQILDNTEIFHAFIAAKILCRMSGQDFTIPEFTDVESMLRLFTEFLEKDKAIKENVGAKEESTLSPTQEINNLEKGKWGSILSTLDKVKADIMSTDESFPVQYERIIAILYSQKLIKKEIERIKLDKVRESSGMKFRKLHKRVRRLVRKYKVNPDDIKRAVDDAIAYIILTGEQMNQLKNDPEFIDISPQDYIGKSFYEQTLTHHFE